MTDEPPHDPDADSYGVGRRTFFRQLTRSAVRAAGNAAGTAQAIRRGSVVAAGGLLGFGFDETAAADADDDVRDPAEALPGPQPWSGRDATTVPATASKNEPRRSLFRSPYRLDGESLILIDQWRLPDELNEVTCADAVEVARAMTDQVVRGAPVLGQVGAYGLALTVRRARDMTMDERHAAVTAAAAALLAARPSVQPLAYAVERMLARWEIARAQLDLDGAADAMRAEADAIASESQYDHARLTRRAAASIATPHGRPIGVLVHGNAGALAGGQVGTALGVVQRLVADGRPVHVWATESRPSLDGARLTALELRRMEAPFTLVSDSAAGWVLANEPIDAVLFGAEAIARNGDTANTIGTLPIAAVAAALKIPVLVCAPSCAIAPGIADGAGIARETDAQGEPMMDVTPAVLISAIYTEEGRAAPSATDQVAAAYERGAQRRLPQSRTEKTRTTATTETTAVAG